MADSNDTILATFKILVIGDSGVGKSSLLLRFIDNKFDENSNPTIGVDFRSKELNIDGNVVRLAIWDTAGQERFRALTPSFYRGAHAVVLVYDVTSRESFQKLTMWMNEIENYGTRRNMVKMVVGNKTDRESERLVSKDEGRAFASRFHTLYLESSAKTNEGVQVAFEEIAQKIIQTPGLWDVTNETIRLDNSQPIYLSVINGIVSCAQTIYGYFF